MTAPTRRQLMAGSLATVGAAGAPAIAIAADPDERVRLAVQEVHAAVQERWPGRRLGFKDALNDDDDEDPPFLLIVVHRDGQP